eukprot:8910962-Lingulodinium_polyedra.AAC.1
MQCNSQGNAKGNAKSDAEGNANANANAKANDHANGATRRCVMICYASDNARRYDAMQCVDVECSASIIALRG